MLTPVSSPRPSWADGQPSLSRNVRELRRLWLGTLPALVLAGRFAAHLDSQRNRRAGAAVVAAFALLGLYRVLLAPALPGAGPFCRAP